MKALFRRAQKRVTALTRIFAIIAVVASPLAVSASANAALTSPTWTVMDPRTNIAGNRYDYGFTTGTAGTVSRVTATVPAGTTGSNRYFVSNGVLGNNMRTNNSAANTITGDIDLRAYVAPTSWTPGSYFAAVSKWGGSTARSYALLVGGAGNLGFNWSPDGSAQSTSNSTVPTGFAAGTAHWIRVTMSVNNGSGGNTETFYTSSDGSNWTVLGSPVVNAGIASIGTTSFSVEVGGWSGGGATMNGKAYYADVRGGIGGTTTSPSTCTSTNVVQCFNPNNDTVGGTSWTSASPSAETWSVYRSGTNAPSDIASDLSVMNISGIPAGGIAQLREIDGVANYTLPTPTAIAAGAAVKLGLAGMTNSYNTGSYTSVLTTLDSTSTAIDTSAATSAVTIAVPTISTAMGFSNVLQSSATATSINVLPSSVVAVGSYIYIGDNFTSSILRLDPTTGLITRFAGNGLITGSGTGPALSSVMAGTIDMSNDASGNVYFSDSYNQSLKKITIGTSTISSTAGGCYGVGSDNINPIGACFNSLVSSAFAANGDIYIADVNNNRIRVVDHTSGLINTAVGTGTTPGSGGDGGQATSAYLRNPWDVVVDNTNGILYIADNGNYKIRKVVLSTGVISTFAGTGSSGYSGDGAAATSATFRSVKSLALDGSNNLYVTDSTSNVVRKIDRTTNIITTVAGNGTAGFSGDGAAATSAMLSAPTQISIDSSGTLYIVDASNFRLRMVTTSGIISTVVGNGVGSFQNEGAQAAGGTLFSPRGLGVDNSGNLLIADPGNQVVRRVDQWNTLKTVAGSGWQNNGFSGDSGAATSAKLASPQSVTTGPDGSLYIADFSNARIRKVDPSGVITTFVSDTSNVASVAFNIATNEVWYTTDDCRIKKADLGGTSTVVAGTSGTCTSTGDNGLASASTENKGTGIICRPTGDCYFIDQTLGAIRKISRDGIISTIAGGGAGTTSGTAARSFNLNGPTSLTVDPLGNFYVSNATRVYRFTENGLVVAFAGSNSAGYSGDSGSALSATINATGGRYGSLTSKLGGLALVNGALYISDAGSNTIRKIDLVAPVVPLVNADSMSVPMNTKSNWPILSNDWSRSTEMDPSSVAITSAPTHGTVTISNPSTEATTLQALYTPTASYTGTDSFTYQACDTTKVLCASATVSVTVSSNQFTTVAGGIAEGNGTDISMYPQDMTRYRGYLFVADTNFNVIRRIDTYTQQVVTVAGTGIAGTSAAVAPATSIAINSPRGIAVAPDGTLVLAMYGEARIKRVSPNGSTSVVAGTGVVSSTGDGGLATSATLSNPVGITFGPDGSVLTGTTGAVRRFTLDGNISTIAGTGTSGYSGNGGVATAAQVSNVRGVAASSNGDIYISDTDNCVVRKISSTGLISAFAGTGACASTGDGGLATAAAMSYQRAIALDPTGTNLYIAESSGSRIRKVALSTNIISTVAGSGASTADGISATTAALNGPGGMGVGDGGDFWIADSAYARVRYVNTSGIINTIAGTSSSSYASRTSAAPGL